MGLLCSLLVAGDALARRGGGLRALIGNLLDQIAGVEERVATIEESDCGCPGVFQPVCARGITWLNLCEALCSPGDLDSLSGGPCEADLPLCGEAACTAGHICVDGACVRDLCNGFREHRGCRDTGCPRGSRCAIYPESSCVSSYCSCDPETGSFLCTQDCGGGVCIPDGETGFPAPEPLPDDTFVPIH